MAGADLYVSSTSTTVKLKYVTTSYRSIAWLPKYLTPTEQKHKLQQTVIERALI